MPPLPDGIGTLVGLLVIFGLFFNGVYALSFGQAALGGRGIGEAIGDGIAGTFKNVLPLLVMLVVVLVAGVVAMVAVGLVMALLAAIGSLVHPAVAMLLVAPVYLALLVAIYVIAFGVMYYMWRDICGDAAPVPAVRPTSCRPERTKDRYREVEDGNAHTGSGRRYRLAEECAQPRSRQPGAIFGGAALMILVLFAMLLPLILMMVPMAGRTRIRACCSEQCSQSDCR